MKNVEFSTSKGKFIVVDFIDGNSFAGVVNGTAFYFSEHYNREDYPYSISLDYKVEYMGDPREFTIDEWEGIVLSPQQRNEHDDHVTVYKNYLGEGFFGTVTESGISLLKANGVSLPEWKNPIMFKIKE